MKRAALFTAFILVVACSKQLSGPSKVADESTAFATDSQLDADSDVGATTAENGDVDAVGPSTEELAPSTDVPADTELLGLTRDAVAAADELDSADSKAAPMETAAPQADSDAFAPDLPPDVPAAEIANADATLDSGKPGCTAPAAPSGLPLPGATCTKPGEVRCTAAGAFAGKITYGMTAGAIGACVLPNRVICTKTPAGALNWVLAPCGEPVGICSPNAVGSLLYPMCQELPGGALCGPTSIGSGGAITWMCPEALAGTRVCTLAGGEGTSITVCSSFDTVAAQSVAEDIKQDKFAKVGGCATKNLYWFPDELCPGVDMCNCLGLNFEDCPPKYAKAQACLTNLPAAAGVATCAKTCADMKFSTVWGPLFKNNP